MSGLHDIERHIGSMEELRDVVGAMRALAGMRLQKAEQALPGVRRYAEAMAAAVQSAWRLQSAGAGAARRREAGAGAGARAVGRRVLILCTSEHGFVGGFNERLLEAAGLEPGADDELYVLGSRGAALGLERGRVIQWSHPMATRLAAIPEIVNRLSERLFTAIGAGHIVRVDALFASARSGGRIQRRQLLPLESGVAPARSAGSPSPLHNLPAQALLEGLAAEYVFALLTQSAVESLAAENAARFAAMDSARDNVSRQLTALRASAHQLRQAEITEELLDLVTGEEALRRPSR